jgi:hypothetical protein
MNEFTLVNYTYQHAIPASAAVNCYEASQNEKFSTADAST